MKSLLIFLFIILGWSNLTYSQQEKSAFLVKRIQKIENQFAAILGAPSKSSFKQQRKLLVETFATLDQGVTYAIKEDKLDSSLSDALARLSVLAAANSPSGFAKRRIVYLYKKHPNTFKQSIQRLPSDQSAFVFSAIKDALEKEGYCSKTKSKKPTRKTTL